MFCQFLDIPLTADISRFFQTSKITEHDEYLDGGSEKLSDGGLEFVGQRQQEDTGFVDKPLLNASSTQQLQRRDFLQHDNGQYVTADGHKDPPVVVTPG